MADEITAAAAGIANTSALTQTKNLQISPWMIFGRS